MTLLIIALVFVLLALLARAMVQSYKRAMHSSQPKFPVLSISLLAVSFVLLISSIYVSLFVDDGLSNFLATTAGFLGLLESHMRHKREALATAARPDETS